MSENRDVREPRIARDVMAISRLGRNRVCRGRGKTGNAGGTTNEEGEGEGLRCLAGVAPGEQRCNDLCVRPETVLRFRERPRGRQHGPPVRVRDARMSCYLNHRGAHCTHRRTLRKGYFELFSTVFSGVQSWDPRVLVELSQVALRAGDRLRRYCRWASAPFAVPLRPQSVRPVVRRRSRCVRSPGSRAPCPP